VPYRAIAGQCETAGRSPRSEAWRTIPKHRTDEERRGRPATYRNIPGTPARNTRHIIRSSSTDRSICGRRIPPGKRRVATMHRKHSRSPWSPGGAARRDHLQAAAETAPAGRSHTLTPRLNQAISSRHDFLYLRQKRGREIDDMKAHRRGYSTFSSSSMGSSRSTRTRLGLHPTGAPGSGHISWGSCTGRRSEIWARISIPPTG